MKKRQAIALPPRIKKAVARLRWPVLGFLLCAGQMAGVYAPFALAAVTAAGYGAAPESEARRDLHAEQDAAVKAMGRRLLWSVVCLVPLFYLSMGHMMGLPVPMFMHTQPLLSAFVLLALIGGRSSSLE